MSGNGPRQRRIVAKSQAIQRERIRCGFTAKDFARRLGITRAGLSLIETRKRGTSEATAIEIARLLGSAFSDLFDIIEPEAGADVEVAMGVAERKTHYAGTNDERATV